MLNYKRARFWIIILTVLIVIVLYVGLIAKSKTPTTFNGSSYRVKEILYDAPIYSFTYRLGTAPQYSISSDYVLYSKQTTDEDWIMHDGLYQYKISIQKLSALFIPLYKDVQNEIDQAKRIYRADTNDDNQTFYLVIQQKDGDVLLAVGYDNKETPHIRWLFKLESVNESLLEKSALVPTAPELLPEQEEKEFIGLSDLNWDNQEESIYLDKSLIDQGLITLNIIDLSNVELWSEQLSTSHAGWNQLFLCELDNQQYLLQYNPMMYQGYCTYVYTLFTLENGKENVFHTNKLEFDINGIKELDVPQMIAFADEVNALLDKSALLISSNGGDFSFGSSSAEPFFERFSWLDDYEKFFLEEDDLETRLNKFNNAVVE